MHKTIVWCYNKDNKNLQKHSWPNSKWLKNEYEKFNFTILYWKVDKKTPCLQIQNACNRENFFSSYITKIQHKNNRNTNICENSKLWKKMNRNTFTNTMRNTHTDFEQQAICIQCVITSWGHDSLTDLVWVPAQPMFFLLLPL